MRSATKTPMRNTGIVRESVTRQNFPEKCIAIDVRYVGRASNYV